jgi:hypothetical protein
MSDTEEILELFFDHPKVGISITEQVLKAAAEDSYIDEELWTFLLNKRDSEVPITEEIVTLAARNLEKCNMLITKLLDAYATVIPTTPAVIEGIVGHLNRPTVEMFVNITGAAILITKSLIGHIPVLWRSSDEVLEFVLEKGTTRDETMDEVINTIARRSDPATLQKFLTRSGVVLHIGEDMVEAAARNRDHGCEMMTFFLESYGEVPVTEQAIKSAFKNMRSGHLIVALLVKESANKIPMTEWVISMIAIHQSGSVFRQLLDQRASDIPITAWVIDAIARGGRNSEEEWGILFENGILTPDAVGEVIESIVANLEGYILQLFIDQKGVEIQVTEEIVHAAMKNSLNGNDMMTIILENRDRRAPITKKAINLIATAFDNAILQQSLDGGDIDILTSQELFLAAAGNTGHGKEVVRFLLEEYTEDISVTEEVVVAAAHNWRSGQDILALLLDRRDGMIPVTEEALCAIIDRLWDSAETLMLILEKSRTDIPITEDILREAAETRPPSLEILRLLLDRQGSKIKITEPIVNAAAGNGYHAKDLVALLLDKGGSGIPITTNTIEVIIDNEEGGLRVLTMLLERGMASIPLTERTFERARNRNRSHKLMKLLPHFISTDRDDVGLPQRNSQNGYMEERFGMDMLTRVGACQSYLYLSAFLIILLSFYLGRL